MKNLQWFSIAFLAIIMPSLVGCGMTAKQVTSPDGRFTAYGFKDNGICSTNLSAQIVVDNRPKVCCDQPPAVAPASQATEPQPQQPATAQTQSPVQMPVWQPQPSTTPLIGTFVNGAGCVSVAAAPVARPRSRASAAGTGSP